MSGEEEEKNGMTKGESATSLIGEGIDSREGTPSPSTNDEVEEPTSTTDAVTGPPPAEDIPTTLSGEGGKPPRAPHLLQPRPSPVSRNTTAEHGRERSIGEWSAMSALTDPDAGEDIGLPYDRVEPQTESIAMPILGETVHVDMAKPVPPMSPPTITSTPAPQRANRNWGKVREALAIQEEDLSVKTVNPLETEAEAAILRALDRTRKRNAAKAGNILPHVSDEAAAAFKQQDATPEQSNVSSSSNRKPSGDERSVLSGATSPSAPKGHDRTKTLDNTLFDLATKLTNLQNQDTGGGGRPRTYTADSAVGRGRLFSDDKGLAAAAATSEYNANSGDLLVQNAAALFRRPLTKREESVGSSESPPPSPSHKKLDSTGSNTSGRRFNNILSQRSTESHKKTDEVILEGAESNESNIDVELGVHTGVKTSVPGDGHDEAEGGRKRKKFGFRKAGKIVKATNDEVKEDFDTFRRFLQPRTRTIKFYLLSLVGCVIIPGIAIAAILFHTTNPGLGRDGASTSWFTLFLVRNVITGTLAKCTEVFLIDFLSLHLRLTVRLFGTIFTLLVVQSKGWPSIMFWWGVFNFAMNSGKNPFAQHWLFWQDTISLFNADNPSGTITSSRANYTVNGIAVVLGFIVAVKRLWWGLYLGRRTYRHYGDELAKVIKNMVAISQVAHWAKEIEKHGKNALKKRGFESVVTREVLSSYRVTDLDGDEQSEDEMLDYVDLSEPRNRGGTGKVIDENRMNALTGTLTQSQVMRINELLGRWEEPEIVGEQEDKVSIASILQFRQMLAYMEEDYPFSLAFGPAHSRDACVESAQKVYSRLMLLTPDEIVLPFDTLAVLAKGKDGEIDTEDMKTLIRLFRPERNGDLTCLDFVKSCDEVYKEMRLLRASIANSGQIDHAFEILVNVAFYLIVGIIVLIALNMDPLALFVSVSGIILAFAFMIGSASSKYFEGILFILVRRPYDIGDRIAIANADTNASLDGSATWFVQSVGLFTTTVRFAATNEVATLANGSLAASRVINAKRSTQANCYVHMKFSVDVPYSKVLIFRKAVEDFIKDRPREWIALNGFRATRVEQDCGFIEYIIALGHRKSWQDIGLILQSKADVASFCLELAKKLDMRYTAPPLPVNLNMANASNMQLIRRDQRSAEDLGEAVSPTPSILSPDVRSISALFKKEG